MGRRRIRLLSRINKECSIIGVDSREDRRRDAQKQLLENHIELTTYEGISDIPLNLDVDAAIICTSPITHNPIIRECLGRNWNVFTEINLIPDGYDENMKLAREKGRVLYLSSTPMFRREIRHIIQEVESGKDQKCNYVFHVGQYLPDWHPWESYKSFFVGQKRTNGCREILAIELPWLIKCFGNIKSVSVNSSRKTSLDIDYNDCYNILIMHEGGHTGVIVVDVVCRCPVRYLEIFNE